MLTLLAQQGGDPAAAALGLVFLIVMFLVGLAFYFAPTILAFSRGKGNAVAILVVNLFFGWSLIGWVVALVWALTQEQRPVIVQQTFVQGGQPPGNQVP